MQNGKVTILGSNGHIGNAAMIAFRDAGWEVTGLGRSNRKPVTGTHFFKGDADEVAAVRAAIAEADIVVQALHLRYDQWGNGRAEKQLQVVIDVMAGSGKTLLFPGTIYNYRAGDRTIAPGLRQSGEKPRGEIRIRLEQMLRQAAENHGFQVIILRAGDFFGPGNRDEWFDAAMLMDYAKGRLYHLGDLETRHSWAYLPDLARAFTVLAARRSEMKRFENFHFAGHWVSHGQIMAAIQNVLPGPVRIAPLPWWMLRAAGLLNPVMRDIYRMRYLWLNEMELVDPRLDSLLGPGFTTPIETAVAETVTELVADRSAARHAA
ncbi:nucleoside-diphosphate-sugar epimerase [Devosia subaequoris]|uniref:Nucleoside-diphosphate-sugar epimerase n=1 Tax=Devosia subaequoris TaxID=395930 RepID=A0A7W6IQN0_9HYPH|nr:NAD-dependent epimerase/dehydratase family protein [Devosia subaequoris]MBB4053406.1 nucleoside-diphosphate-sugar epimerase [Devosia subaequoris]MCP1210783.1 NAD-dependent epimerase/dehydratase family protein [Devosia subaequoris]